MEILPIIIFAIVSAIIKSRNNGASNAQKRAHAKRTPKDVQQKIEDFLETVSERLEEDKAIEEKKVVFDHFEEKPLKPAAPAAAKKTVNAVQTQLDLKKAEPHEHEGKQGIPCPADEREAKAAQNTVPQTVPAPAPAVPGLKLNFDRDSVLQAFVLSEVLNRPRSASRR